MPTLGFVLGPSTPSKVKILDPYLHWAIRIAHVYLGVSPELFIDYRPGK